MGLFEKTFDNAADDYEQSRPDYPDALYSDIFRYLPVGPGSRVLEIGMGTGKASGPFLGKGCCFVGLEPGKALAAVARRRLQNKPSALLRCERFQDYEALPDSFDLIYAATAFHWIPEEYGYPRVLALLKTGGAFARFAYHAGPDQSRPELARQMNMLYREIMWYTDAPAPFGAAQAQSLAQLAEKYGFTDAEYHLYQFTKDFTADGYMALLRTYPDHMNLEERSRKALFDGIHTAIRQHGGTITVHYTADLELARKP